MGHEDRVCPECGELFRRPVGIAGRPAIYCSKRCRKKVARERAALRLIDLETCDPWDGSGLERWGED